MQVPWYDVPKVTPVHLLALVADLRLTFQKSKGMVDVSFAIAQR